MTFFRHWTTLLVLFAGGTLPAQAADWPQWRGPNRNGTADGEIPAGAKVSFKTRWTAEVGIGFSSISVANGRAYTVGNQEGQETIWCLNAQNGQVVWTFKYTAPLDANLFEGGPTATPTVIADRVYAISRPGDVFCLRAGTGEVVWQTAVPEELKQNPPSWGYSGSPLLIGDDKVLLNVGSHGLCLNTETGEVIWTSDGNEKAGYTSPVLVHPEAIDMVLLESEKTLNAIEPTTGQVLWSFPWITRYGINAADPLLLDQHHVIVSSGYGKGTSQLEFGPDEVKELWRVRNLKSQMSPGVVVEGNVYATDGDAGQATRLVCLDPADGKIRWEHRGLGSSSVIAVGDSLLVLSDAGELLIVPAKPEGFEVSARQQILEGKCWTPPAYVDRVVYARNAAGKIVAVELNSSNE